MMSYQKVDILHVNDKIVLSHVYLVWPIYRFFLIFCSQVAKYEHVGNIGQIVVILHPELCDNKCLVCVDCHSHN